MKTTGPKLNNMKKFKKKVKGKYTASLVWFIFEPNRFGTDSRFTGPCFFVLSHDMPHFYYYISSLIANDEPNDYYCISSFIPLFQAQP